MFQVIHDFEKHWSWFNREPLTSEEVLEWAEQTGLHCLEDRSITYGFATYFQGNRLIFYNPHLPEAEKILVIGHEVGHQLLGHMAYLPANNFSKASLFERTGLEKDASIIGYLCMIPSLSIIRLLLENDGHLAPEDLYAQFRHLWSDLEENYSYRLCQARIRIFMALLQACHKRGPHGSKYLKDQFGFMPRREGLP